MANIDTGVTGLPVTPNGGDISTTWTATGGSIPAWRYAVMYLSGTVAGMVNPLVGYFLGDSTPADVPATTVGNPLTITAPTAGWFSATQA